MYIYFNKTKGSLETFSESGYKFSFYIVIKLENAGRNWYHGVIQLLQRQQKESPRLQNYGTLHLPFGIGSKRFKPITQLCVQ